MPPRPPKMGRRRGTGRSNRLGRSRGGFTTKVHIGVDALGNPVEFVLTPGQRADVAQADELLAGQDAAAVIADKGYDSDPLVRRTRAKGGAGRAAASYFKC